MATKWLIDIDHQEVGEQIFHAYSTGSKLERESRMEIRLHLQHSHTQRR